MTSHTNVYEQVTNQIIRQLEQGVPPWRQPWATLGGGMPTNVVSQRGYRGVNILLLWGAAQARGYDSNLWGTFGQFKTLNGFVRKGEKATRIVFWKIVTETVCDRVTGFEREEKRFFARQYSVFNLCQCGGDDLDHFRVSQPAREFTDFAPAEEAFAATGATIEHGAARAYYNLDRDVVHLPIKEAFDSEASYYSTLAHEIIHFSGHPSRLNRLDRLSRFGSKSYAAEELVAELGAAFLTATLGIPNCGIQDNAAYLENWLQVLRADNRAIFTASSAAAAASDYVLSFSQQETPEESEELAELPF